MSAPQRITDYLRQPPHDDRAYGQRNEDPYQIRGKYSEPAACTDCGAVFKKGRWQWEDPEPDAHKLLCPACQRKRDNHAAGVVSISGDFFTHHKDEILGLIHNVEEKAKSAHPLQRIMSLKHNDREAIVSLTDFHLTHAIVEALKHAYQGESEEQFVEKDSLMRASWRR